MQREYLNVKLAVHFITQTVCGFRKVKLLPLPIIIIKFVMFFRHILAICHFNENVNRERRKTVDGVTYYNVVFPKYKLGEEVVREVAVCPTYS